MRVAIAAIVIGAGAEGTSVAIQQLYPDAPTWVWVSFFVVGLALILLGIVMLAGSIIPKRDWLSANLPFRPLVPLNEAARIAYEETEGTLVGKAAERMLPDDTLGYFVYALADGQIPVYGIHPPSTKQRLIQATEFAGGLFVEDGEAYQLINNDAPLFKQLRIKRRDMRRRIREMKKMTLS